MSLQGRCQQRTGIETAPVIVAPTITTKLRGAAQSLPEWQDIRHPNGNTYDQVLMTGPAETVFEGEIEL